MACCLPAVHLCQHISSSCYLECYCFLTCFHLCKSKKNEACAGGNSDQKWNSATWHAHPGFACLYVACRETNFWIMRSYFCCAFVLAASAIFKGCFSASFI